MEVVEVLKFIMVEVWDVQEATAIVIIIIVVKVWLLLIRPFH
jgi:hypothetical protein